jgi:hypothetical protein
MTKSQAANQRGPSLNRHQEISKTYLSTKENVFLGSTEQTPPKTTKENRTSIGDTVHLAYLHTLSARLEQRSDSEAAAHARSARLISLWSASQRHLAPAGGHEAAVV